MQIGLYVNTAGPGPSSLIDQVRAAADAGLDSVHFSQLLSWDALTVAALSAQAVPDIALGTAIVPTYPRHPIALAGQALTVQAASTRPFTLGIGPSHPQIIEGVFGYSFDRPARHIREYLSVLRPLLRGEQVDHHSPTLTAVGAVAAGATPPPSVLLSALGPTMVRIAGELADGTVTVWTGARLIGEYLAPALTRAATAAGRPAPRVVAAVMAVVTADPEAIRRSVADQIGFASQFPAYRAQLARQRYTGIEQTVLAGDEDTVARGIREFADAGVTELLVSTPGNAAENARTLRLASDLRPQLTYR